MVTHQRIGDKTEILVNGHLSSEIIETRDGRETTTSFTGKPIMSKMIFPKAVFTLADGEQLVGEFQYIHRLGGQQVRPPSSVTVTAKKIDLDQTLYEYRMFDGENFVIKLLVYKPGYRLPFGISIQKFSTSRQLLLTQELFRQ